MSEITKTEFEKLLVDYGNSCFACGEFNGDGVASYEQIYRLSEQRKAVVLEAFDLFVKASQ